MWKDIRKACGWNAQGPLRSGICSGINGRLRPKAHLSPGKSRLTTAVPFPGECMGIGQEL